MTNRVDSSAFWDAIDADDSAAVESVLAVGVDIVARSRANRDGLTPLHYAAQRGALDALLTILQHTREVDPRDRWGSTPLHNAVMNSTRGGVEPVAALLAAGADPRSVNDLGVTPLSAAQNLAGVPTTLVELLHDRRPATDVPPSALLTAARSAGVDGVLAALAESGALNDEHDDETPLRAIVRRSLPVRPNRPNPHPLGPAAALTLAEALVHAGAEVQRVHADGFTSQGFARSFLAPKELVVLLDTAAKEERS